MFLLDEPLSALDARVGLDNTIIVLSSDHGGPEAPGALSELGRVLAALRQPEPPRGVSELWEKLPMLRDLLRMAPKTVRDAPCQEVVIEADDVDLRRMLAVSAYCNEARLIEVDWGGQLARTYPVSVHIEAIDRQGLLREDRKSVV